MRLKSAFVVLVVMSLMLSCATATSSGCEWVKKIYPHSTDISLMSTQLMQDLLAHNIKVDEFCR